MRIRIASGATTTCGSDAAYLINALTPTGAAGQAVPMGVIIGYLLSTDKFFDAMFSTVVLACPLIDALEP